MYVPPESELELMSEGRQEEMREAAAERAMVAEPNRDSDPKRQSDLARLLARFRRSR